MSETSGEVLTAINTGMEGGAVNNTLLIRHLPSSLTSDDKEELFKHFGAVRVKVMGAKGAMKHTAFVTFNDVDAASKALNRLHQLEIMGCKLVAEYAKKSQQKHFPSLCDYKSKSPGLHEDSPGKPVSKSNDEKMQPLPSEDIVYKKWSIDYPRNPKLYYLYPPPTVSILTNIANALAASPKLYVQVLHLMNKMNLPAPFGATTPTPPIPTNEPTVFLEPDNIQTEEMEVSSTEESEIESEGESQKVSSEKPPLKRRVRTKPKMSSKRPKLLHNIQIIPAPTNVPVMDPSKVFETSQHPHPVKKIQLNIPEAIVHEAPKPKESSESSLYNDMEQEDVEKDGGFGKIEPVKKVSQVVEMTDSDMPYIVDKDKFVSKEEIRRGRMSKSEMKNFSVFKKYEAGDKAKRLYLKNLAKNTCEQDLVNIYGNYIDWDSETEKNIFDIRVMKEGRMKGQAFVTLPTEEVAEQALNDTNGFVLNGKPMAVQFARSAKAKDTADEKA